MNLIEQITWIPVDEQLPDDDITVLAFRDADDDAEVWPCWHEAGQWHDAGSGLPVEGVTHWAEMPGGPR